MDTTAKNLNAIVIIILSGILLSAFGVQLIEKEMPCPLCMLQRLGMIGVGIGFMLNLKFGIKPAHYGFSLISALVGGAVALRQISLHVCPQFSKFGLPVLGLSLYTWSFIVFACVVFVIAILLFMYRGLDDKDLKMNGLGKFASILIFIVVFANVITTLIQCGLGPCEDI